MQFEVEFYESSNGACPLRVFLEDLKGSDLKDYDGVLSGLARLKQRHFHRMPYCRALGKGLFELRHKGNLNTRVLWFFVVGQRIIAVHGIRHKAQTLPSVDLGIARERMSDWHRRNGS